MRVRVSDIPTRGVSLQEEIALQPLNEQMQLGRWRDVVFTSAPQVSVQFSRTIGGVQMRGEVKASLKQSCGRCADDVPREIVVPVDLVLQERSEEAKAKARAAADDEVEIDDVGISYYDNDHIEVDPLIYEQLILSIDPYFHPPEDDQGRCSFCKRPCDHALKERVAEQGKKLTLGELLKDAAATGGAKASRRK